MGPLFLDLSKSHRIIEPKREHQDRRMSNPSAAKVLRSAGLLVTVFILALIAWIPRLLTPPNAQDGDMLFEQTAQQILCGVGPITGWPINDEAIGETLGTFAPTLPMYLVARSACTMADVLPVNGLQAFLIIGIGLTVLITYVASRAVGLGIRPSLLISYGLATAPSSFSRFGHLQLSQLWAVMPCIAVCALLIARENYPSNTRGRFDRAGFAGLGMGALSFTGQEYYGVFSILCVMACHAVGCAMSAREANKRLHLSNAESAEKHTYINRFQYTKIAAGYATAMVAYLTSKQILWNIPEWAHQATGRSATEQFMYGFWPSNIITSPLINRGLREVFTTRNHLPVTETPFNSSSGILVIAALALSLHCWIKGARSGRDCGLKNEEFVMAFGGVLITTIAIACIVATSGGLGTLFAVLVSPQLRALNRITPYFYCAALVICAIRFDEIISAIIKRSAREGRL